MGKIGFSKGQSPSKKREVVHKHVNGPAYEIDDAVTKLINITGTFFNEKTYYGDSEDKFTGLTPEATTLIETAQAVAEKSPEDLLVIAAWTRDKKEGRKLRTTPQVLLAIAASNEKTRPFLEKYISKITTRADDIKTVFAAYMNLFVKSEKRTLPRALKSALALAFSKQSAYSLVKYNADNHPTFRDVISMIKGERASKFVENKDAGYPLEKGLYEYLAFGKVSDNSPDIVKNRTKFFKNKDITKVTMEDVEAAGLTWENVISHFGSSPEAWRLIIPFMDEMAITRNLRNFEQANLTDADWKVILSSIEKVDKTVQLPFRFLAAYKEISAGKSKSAVAAMFDKSIANVPDLPGKSVVYTDNSGSMGSSVSEKSKMTCKDAANSLCAILAKKNKDQADINTFSDYVLRVNLNWLDTGITMLEKIEQAGHKTGSGTNIDAIVQDINNYTAKKIHVDRFIMLSDMCMYHYSNAYRGAGLQEAFEKYQRAVNPNAKLYSINLNAYAQTQVDSKSKGVIVMAGWSEQMFSLMLQAEGLEQKKNEVVPTIQLLREKYGA